MRFLSIALLASLAMVQGRTLWTRVMDPSYNYEEWKSEFAALAPSHNEETFNQNLQIIRNHNSQPSASYKMGVNKFAGMTKDEFKEYVSRGYQASSNAQAQRLGALNSYHSKAALSGHKQVEDLPASLDWRTKGVVSDVKDQGQCGGCWAFSTSETVESAVAIATGKLLTLSEQEILDCTPNPQKCGGSGGCGGATQELGFGWIASNGGVADESSYPYNAYTGTCNKSAAKVATISGYVALPPNNYTALMNAAATMPIAISAAANAWQLYESGVLNTNCGTDVDHAIQLVGWGTDPSNGDYYTVRNSWGPYWGESGYIRIARFGEGKEPCGTDNTPLDGDGCQGGPSSIPVCGLCGILSDSSYPTGAGLPN